MSVVGQEPSVRSWDEEVAENPEPPRDPAVVSPRPHPETLEHDPRFKLVQRLFPGNLLSYRRALESENNVSDDIPEDDLALESSLELLDEESA